MSIQVQQLVKVYGEQKAVNNISFTVQQGEIVGFLGPNGAGKSTTMKMITGYLQPTSGEAYVCGIPVSADPLAIKKKIGYLPELNALYYDMYVKEYLQFIAELHGVPDKKKSIANVLELTGLSRESSKKIGQLSKGYKQRVGLAAALIHEPEVLILDEPTSGLDPNQIIEIREVIKKQGQQKTVLFSSHILQEVEAICDRVIIINQGNLVADDTMDNLRKGNKQQHTVVVHFNGNVDKQLFENLHGMLIGISDQGGNKNSQYRWETDNPDLLSKQIFELALQHSLKIVSLQSESQSLEEVFRTLTSPGTLKGDV